MKSEDMFLRIALSVIMLAAWGLAARAGDEKQCPDDTAAVPLPPLAYEVSAYELSPLLRAASGRCWTLEEVKSELSRRIAAEKQCGELHVNYYRIGHTLAFPLPLAWRPADDQLPVGIEGMRYPWTTWLSWRLDERWRTLHAAWRRLGDKEAGALLQRELAALAGWDRLGLFTGGRIESSLAMALADASGWDADLQKKTLAAAESLLTRDVQPWLERTWDGKQPVTPARLHNAPVITLVRSAQLARTIGSPLSEKLDARAREVLHAWWKYRTGEERHSEGTAYDGFVADAVTEWLAGLPDREALLSTGREAFCGLARQWVQLTLPGRADLHAPLGDTEPEMSFWATALVRLAAWYDLEDAGWLLRRYPLERLPIPALTAVLDCASFWQRDFSMPKAGPCEHPAAVSLRTGWQNSDLLVAVGLPRCNMGHLHADGGQVILGWQGRFWITDPGYQQYRPGAEREYTVGPQAHNAPVIAGAAQTRRIARLLALATDKAGRQHAALDLTGGYEGLPKGARVQRDVWLIPAAHPAVVVRDSFVPPGVEVQTHWLGGASLAWAFSAGWARLSDGEHALWIGTAPGKFQAGKLLRHPGSRGPLTLQDITALPEGNAVRWWVFQTGRSVDWSSPQLIMEGDALKLRPPGQDHDLWSVP